MPSGFLRQVTVPYRQQLLRRAQVARGQLALPIEASGLPGCEESTEAAIEGHGPPLWAVSLFP